MPRRHTNQNPSSSSETSLKCKKTSDISINQSVSSKLFAWNRELPRHNSEYVDKNYDKPFTKIAEQLNTIGGLGRVRCINKKSHGKLVNRPTQVERISHMTTKVLPNFSLTQQLKPIVCERMKDMSIHEHVECARLAENLPINYDDEESTQAACASDTMKSFNHENPFNLDLNALSEYQRQRSTAEDIQRRRNYQIIRRTMETMKLKTEGVERIKQEERDEKFRLPLFFQISHSDEDERETAENTDPEGVVMKEKYMCGAVSMLDKPKNKQIVEEHFKHKEDKLRQRIRNEKTREEALKIEMEAMQREAKENEIFRLADESFPASECSFDNDSVAASTSAITKFDYRTNKMKLSSHQCERLVENSLSKSRNQIDAKNRVPCGQRIGKRVILRGFHDRTCSEPRGLTHLHRMEMSNDGEHGSRTQKELLETITNDPKIVNPPPKGKILSSLKDACDPNDDKMPLFPKQKPKLPSSMMKNSKETSNKRSKKMVIGDIESPIKRYIKEINIRLKQKYLSMREKRPLKSQIDVSALERRYQRMKFMGIPTEMIAAKIDTKQSSIRVDEAKTSKDSLKILVPEAVKLMPTIPSLCCCDMNEECMKKPQIEVFDKAQPRGNDPEMLRTDKSMPWIYNDINSFKAVIGKSQEEKIEIDNWNHVAVDDPVVDKTKEIDAGNQSELKRSFHNLIASKLETYKNSAGDDNATESNNNNNNNKNHVEENCERKSAQSISTLSSDGTYFTNDSGSYIVILDEKIPKSQINIGKKFQNHSLVTTKVQPSLENEPYFVGDVHTLKQLRKPPDHFHTQKTRSCANIRERVRVESVEYEDELIGNEKSKLAADIDEYYVKEFYNHRSRAEFRYKRLTEVTRMRESFHKKIETYYMKEKLMIDEIQAEKDARILENVTSTVVEYEKFLKDIKEQSSRRTMRIMQDVKRYYHTTSQLETEREHLQSQVEPMKMKIFYLGNDFLRLSRYQHFQYLLMPMEWRIEHDHLHRNSADGRLEDEIESLKNRDMRNVWDRQNVSIEAIIDFISNVHCKRTYEFRQPFSSGREMLDAMDILQSKSLKVLTKFTLASMTHSMLENQLVKSNETSEEFIGHFESTTKRLHKRWKFLETRCNEFFVRAREVLDKPLEESFQSDLMHKLDAYCKVMFEVVFSGASGTADLLTKNEKFQMIEDKVLKMFSQIDKIPEALFQEIEKKVRKERGRKLKTADRAYKIELNIQHTMKQLERLYAKPAQRKIKTGKHERFFLPKRQSLELEESPLLDPLEQEYLQAFSQLSDDKNINDAKFDPNVKLMIEKIKNESTPFYVDRFIESLGINMKKLSQQDGEKIIKDEEAKLKFKDVLPSVRMKVKFMENEMSIQKELDIKKTMYIYERK